MTLVKTFVDVLFESNDTIYPKLICNILISSNFCVDIGIHYLDLLARRGDKVSLTCLLLYCSNLHDDEMLFTYLKLGVDFGFPEIKSMKEKILSNKSELDVIYAAVSNLNARKFYSAKTLFLMSAILFNDPTGQYCLGICYIKGMLGNFDIERGVFYLNQAALNGCFDAAYYLATGYISGENYLPKNTDLGGFYLKIANTINPDDELIAGMLASYCYTHGEKEKSYQLINTMKTNQKGQAAWVITSSALKDNEAESSLYFAKIAAENDVASAQYWLFQMYSNGDLGVRDHGLALSYLRMCIENNFIKGFIELANCYKIGKLGVEKDISKAMFYYEHAAEYDDPEACYELGKLYLDGIEIEQDRHKATYYLTRSSKAGHSAATRLLEKLNL